MSSVSAAGAQAFTAQAYAKQQEKADPAKQQQPVAQQSEALNSTGDRGTVLNVKA